MLFVKKMAVWLIVLSLPLSSAALAQSWSQAELEAKGVLHHYLDALKQGDTHTLRSLMAGDLLDSRSMLLENPLWPGYLGSAFGNAQFSVQDMETSGPNEVRIDVLIQYGADDFSLRRFVLRRDDPDLGGSAPFRVMEEHDPEFLDYM